MHSLAEAVRLSDKLKDMCLVCQPVQECSRHDLVCKNGIPISKAQISRDNDGNPFIEVRAQLKKKLCSVFGKGNEAQFIQHHQIKLGNRFHELGEAQLIFCGKQ